MVAVPKPTPVVREPKKLKGRPHAIPKPVRDDTLEQYGYQCQWCNVQGGALDLHQFEELLAEARAAMDEVAPGHAADRLRAALALWRGSALDGVLATPSIQTRVRRPSPRSSPVIRSSA